MPEFPASRDARIEQIERELFALAKRLEHAPIRNARVGMPREVRLAKTCAPPEGDYPTALSQPNTYWIQFVDGLFDTLDQGLNSLEFFARRTVPDADRPKSYLAALPPRPLAGFTTSYHEYIEEGTIVFVKWDRVRQRWWIIRDDRQALLRIYTTPVRIAGAAPNLLAPWKCTAVPHRAWSTVTERYTVTESAVPLYVFAPLYMANVETDPPPLCEGDWVFAERRNGHWEAVVDASPSLALAYADQDFTSATATVNVTQLTRLGATHHVGARTTAANTLGWAGSDEDPLVLAWYPATPGWMILIPKPKEVTFVTDVRLNAGGTATEKKTRAILTWPNAAESGWV